MLYSSIGLGQQLFKLQRRVRFSHRVPNSAFIVFNGNTSDFQSEIDNSSLSECSKFYYPSVMSKADGSLWKGEVGTAEFPTRTKLDRVMTIEELVKECNSWSELFRKFYDKKTPNGGTLTKFKKQYQHLNVSHFDRWAVSRKFKTVEKNCPVCDKVFKTKEAGSESRITCSYSCSNTHFRSGENHGMWNPERYQTTCFIYHKKECVVCKEENIVEVHHYDENHENNDPSNLVPLCPTHHQYWHSRFKHLVEDKVDLYVENFSKSQTCDKDFQ